MGNLHPIPKNVKRLPTIRWNFNEDLAHSGFFAPFSRDQMCGYWTVPSLYSHSSSEDLGADAAQLSMMTAKDWWDGGILRSRVSSRRQRLLGSITDLRADGEINREVDAGDYDIWRLNYGATAGSASGANANAAVPKPATEALLVMVRLTFQR